MNDNDEPLDELEKARKSFWEHAFWDHPIGTGVGIATGGLFVAIIVALITGRKYSG